MGVAVDLAKTLDDITEKLSWAERSVQRLSDATKEKDAIAVQDHFWSFLHASQLLWFYIGRYFESNGYNAGSARAFVQNWVMKELDSTQASLWSVVNSLRSADVHVEPVVTTPKTETRLFAREGKLLVRDGKLLVRTDTNYFVSFQGVQYECQSAARDWIVLARRLMEYLQLNAPR
jgi:hypothetical protein